MALPALRGSADGRRAPAVRRGDCPQLATVATYGRRSRDFGTQLATVATYVRRGPQWWTQLATVATYAPSLRDFGTQLATVATYVRRGPEWCTQLATVATYARSSTRFRYTTRDRRDLCTETARARPHTWRVHGRARSRRSGVVGGLDLRLDLGFDRQGRRGSGGGPRRGCLLRGSLDRRLLGSGLLGGGLLRRGGLLRSGLLGGRRGGGGLLRGLLRDGL